MPGKLIVGTIETQNINFDSDTTGMTLASTGVATIPKTAGMYEHITTKVSATDGSLSSSGAILFPEVFSAGYIHYKVVIGYYNVAASSNGHLYLRWMTGPSTITTASNYNFTLTRQTATNDSYDAVSGTSQTAGKIFHGLWNNINGGIHGEINMYNVGPAPVINGTNTDRGDYYRPICFNDLVGYDESHNSYVRQSGMVRYNSQSADTYHTGFVLDYGQNETAGTHISVYGLRVHA